MTVHSDRVLKPVLNSEQTIALRLAVATHDADEEGHCACGVRLDPHNADAREEHLLEVAFLAGQRGIARRIRARARIPQ